MKPVHAIAAAALLGALAAPMPAALAQSGHGHDHMSTSTAAPATSAPAEGEVRKIDTPNRKVTLKHEASKELGMPAMTMVYQVAEAALLSKVKVGDKVRFQAATAGGKMTITAMEPVR